MKRMDFEDFEKWALMISIICVILFFVSVALINVNKEVALLIFLASVFTVAIIGFIYAIWMNKK